MPCFKGIAVSVHAEGAPLPEYGIQKQSRVSRVSSFIPVPKPTSAGGDHDILKPEPSKFAISITLLVPGAPVPYSRPRATADDPDPSPQMVGNYPGMGTFRGRYLGSVAPYVPLTKSENETVAAYIYFDGRAKEEVATLLRPGEETWVNSRWVQVEDGGLAEREFLFREVGLERWLNGLDLDGHDAAAKLEKRREKFEKRRRRIKEERGSDEDLTNGPDKGNIRSSRVLRYGTDETSPVEKVSDMEDLSSDSDDDAPPEAAGQIKVAMFRVLASGEIKKGEYSPQFDALDDDEDGNKMDADDGDVEHTTSFAKPKTLDPKSISTQTVTGIDGPEKPFAVFTFLYRGERQLQKMGLMKDDKAANAKKAKRRSGIDFASLGPLKKEGTVGFSAFRDNQSQSRNKAKKATNGALKRGSASDSDDDDDAEVAADPAADVDDKDANNTKGMLSPEDAKHTGELADGVDRIKLKRQHSAEPVTANTRRSPASGIENSLSTTPPTTQALDIPPKAHAIHPPTMYDGLPSDDFIGSPLKRHRASQGPDSDLRTRFAGGLGDVLASAEAAQKQSTDESKDL